MDIWAKYDNTILLWSEDELPPWSEENYKSRPEPYSRELFTQGNPSARLKTLENFLLF